MNRLAEAQRAARVEGRSAALEALGFTAAEQNQLARDLAELRRPPLRVPPGVEQAKAALLDLGLLAPTRNEPISYLVHRWTAGTLAGREPPDALTDAHRKAARYWRWRVRVWPQSPIEDLEQLLETRYHHHAAGELDQAIAVTYEVRDQLDTWGAYAWAERLCQETLAWVPSRSREAAAFIHQLGLLAHRRGDYAEAERQCRLTLAIFEKLGDRAHMAKMLSQLGVLLTEKGDIEDAVGYSIHSSTLRLAIGSPDARTDDHWLRRQQELLGDERFDELLRTQLHELVTQLDETTVTLLQDYLNQASQAAPDVQGLQQHLSQWEPVIASMVATVEGNDDAAATLQPLLDELGATSDWGALVAVLRRILAGESGEQLLAGLDAVDTAIVRDDPSSAVE